MHTRTCLGNLKKLDRLGKFRHRRYGNLTHLEEKGWTRGLYTRLRTGVHGGFFANTKTSFRLPKIRGISRLGEELLAVHAGFCCTEIGLGNTWLLLRPFSRNL